MRHRATPFHTRCHFSVTAKAGQQRGDLGRGGQDALEVIQNQREPAILQGGLYSSQSRQVLA